MLRRTNFRLLNFITLLCGVPSFTVKAAPAEADKTLLQYRCRSKKASVPFPLLISITCELIEKKEFPSLIRFLAPHPERDSIALAVCKLLSSKPSSMQVRDWEQLLKVLQYLDISSKAIAASTIFACLRICGSENEKKKFDGDGGSTLEDAENFRLWITRFTRYHPFLAPLALPSLCKLSKLLKGSEAEGVEDDLLDVTLCALRQGHISPEDCGEVITLIEQPRRVLALWRWMQHTSAKWNKSAASAAVIAFARHKRFADAVTALQTLAVVGTHPTVPAQVAFLDLLSRTTPPLPQYGDQLVEYWHPHPEKRWNAKALDVIASQIFLHFRCGNHDECFNILSCAAEHILSSSVCEKERKTAIVQLVRNRKIFQIARHFFDEISKSCLLLRFFFEEPLKMVEEFQCSPSSISIFLSICRRVGGEGKELAFERIRSIAGFIDESGYEKILKYITDDSFAQSSQETLDFVNAIGSLFSRDVPSQIAAWIKLA